MMHRIGRSLTAAACAAAAIALAACTTATPYQPYRPEGVAGVHGGYSEQRLAPDRFIVRFHGNDLTSRERVESYMLYRAAELTLQNGYDSFDVVERNTEHDVQTYVDRDPLYRPWFGRSYGWWRPEWRVYSRGFGWSPWDYGFGGIDMRTVESFEAQAEIVLRRGAPEPGHRSFDARRVMADIGPTIQLPRR